MNIRQPEYRIPFWFSRISKPVTQRIAWSLKGITSLSACVLLVPKAVANWAMGHKKEAVTNLGYAITLYPAVAVLSAFSVISPSRFGNAVGYRVMLPIKIVYDHLFKPVANDPSIQQEIISQLKTHVSSTKRLNATITIPFVNVFNNFSLVKIPDILKRIFKGDHSLHHREPFNFEFPENCFYLEVTGLNGIKIDSVDIRANVKTDKHRIVFQPAATIYQMQLLAHAQQSDDLKCHTRTFNYPGITKKDTVTSLDDIVNSGIAQVWDLVKRNHWSDKDITEKLHLNGQCYGGGIALLVAAFFKEKHHIDMHVFVDRCYSSSYDAASHILNYYTGLPLWYAKILSSLSLYASGDLNSDLMAATKILNPAFVHGTNLGHIDKKEKASISYYENILGLGPAPTSADNVLIDGSAFIDKLEEVKKTDANSSTCTVIRVFNGNKYTPGHFCDIKDMYTDAKVAAEITPYGTPSSKPATVMQFYSEIIESDVKPTCLFNKNFTKQG